MITFEQFYRERFEPDYIQMKLRPNGQIFYRSMISTHVLPTLGALNLQDITTERIQNLILQKQKTYSPQTLRHIRNVISAVLRHAKRMGALTGDLPTADIMLPRNQPAEKRPLSWGQVQQLAALIGIVTKKEKTVHAATRNVQLSSLVRILARTGMRIGEAIGLCWQYVNLSDGPIVLSDGSMLPAHTLAVRRAWNSTTRAYDELKTAKSRRLIPLDAVAQGDFQRLSQGGPNKPVFAADNGAPLDQHNVAARWLKPAAAAIGRPDVSWHLFRHTWASLADQAGLTVTQRQMVLGHAAGSMTLSYSHADLQDTRERMEGVGKATV